MRIWTAARTPGAAALLVVLAAGLTVRAPVPAFAASKRLTVVASFYPLAEAASRVGGRNVRVTNLTPPGVEPHDLELSTDQIDSIDGADLAVVMGSDFQPGVEKAAGRRDGPTTVVLDALHAAPATRGSLVADDPHVWLDPELMGGIVQAVAKALAKADPAHAATYGARADAYVTDLHTLDVDYRAGLADCRRHLLLTSHEAFGYLARAYGLTQEGVSGLAPDAEPDPKRMAQLADLARSRGVTTVFTEELVSPRVARTIAREAGGLMVKTLSPLEGLTANQRAAGDDYLSVMRTNLASIRTALDCR